MNDDSQYIIDRLEGDIEAVLNRYYPGWMKSGGKALLTPKIKPGQKKPTSSFIVHLTGNRRGQFYRFSENVGGGMLQLIHYKEEGRIPKDKHDWAKAFKYAKEFLGIQTQSTRSQEEEDKRAARLERERVEREERDAKAAAEREIREAARIVNAQEAWAAGFRLQGTLGEQYLIGRGIPPISEWPWDCHDTLRFHPALNYERDPHAGRFPAVIGRVQDAFGDTVAIWQIYLDRKLPKKALLENPKLGRGPAAGGAVRIGGDGPRIGAAEGMETAIALWVLEGFRKPIWAMLSTSGMIGFEPPMEIEHVSIYPDGDAGMLRDEKIWDPPGARAAKSLHDRMKSIGIGSNINEMALLGDGLDLLETRTKYEGRSQPRKPQAEGNSGSSDQHQSGADHHRHGSEERG